MRDPQNLTKFLLFLIVLIKTTRDLLYKKGCQIHDLEDALITNMNVCPSLRLLFCTYPLILVE